MIELFTPKEFNFDQIIKFLSRNEKECLHTLRGREIFKVISNENALILFSISFDSCLQISIHSEDKSQKNVDLIKNYVNDWFDLEANLDLFYKTVQTDEVLANLCEKFHGLRMIGMPDLFESLIWSIIGQQINLNFAYSLKERLVHNFGQKILFENESFYALPTPERLANLTIEDFQPLQFSRSKAQYILNVSREFAEGNLSQEALRKLSFEEVKEKLVKIKGIGNWTANYSMMKSLKNYDAFPVEDVGLHNAVKTQYGLTAKPTIKELNQMAEKWKGWRGYATFYFWHSLLG
ncbi:DNA-3-methyladenine glycosylase [Emticicia aquatilis]|uniref:DNA-3-methyladenine glycosylase II n=1 Tax=Emticicia aquatilis TaxID=1537369 RepID=A0A917DY77_9BACT|nr:DNA-3-methyladenine glycosylase [Emticicia aquatilis]GGD78839.1 DNA-3-methyladenine glycosylase [Emticicia aquatilis]